MKTIMFIDTRDESNSSYHSDRQEFYDTLKSDFKIQVVENISSSNKGDIIFIHQSYFSESNIMETSSKRNPLVEKSIFVFYGNNTQGTLEIVANEVSYFNFYVLQKNFKAFIEELSKDDLENLWNILLGFDPELENKLNPFESISPYETVNKQGKSLKDAKVKLQAYVIEYLKKQSKS